MNWIKNFVKPKLRSLLNTVQKRDVPENLWIKDPDSGEMVYVKRTTMSSRNPAITPACRWLPALPTCSMTHLKKSPCRK
jgi:acetyl-CoA carboxylase beta subunit